MIVPAISAERFSRVLALAAQHAALYAALGLHPIVTRQAGDLIFREGGKIEVAVGIDKTVRHARSS
jgi:Tat protein secretion system quality control protein TatD with DNase activity